MDEHDNIKKGKKTARIVGLVFLLIGLVFVGVGGGLTFSSYNFMQNSVETTGKVVSVRPSYNDGTTTYQPTFSYVAADGQQYQGTTFLSSSTYNFGIGAKMGILYDTRDFSNIRLNSWFDTWGFGVIFLVVGLVPMLIGFFIRKSAKKNKLVRRKSSVRDKYVRLDSPESEEDHRRETEYEPTVRR